MNKMKIISIICFFLLFSAQAKAASFMTMLYGCATGVSAGVAGTALASAHLKEGDKISGTGYAISASLSCLMGLSYVAIVGSQAEFEVSYELKKENEDLSYSLKRYSTEKCLLNNTCTPEGRARIVETEGEIKKIGDTVIETYTSTLEVKD